MPGYDGRVTAMKATPFVPSGDSVWEMGAGSDPLDKANRDYRARTNDPLDVDRAQATFVFVTPRRWAGKLEWAQRRRDEGIWANVLAFDVDDLENALDQAPATHYWLSERLGLPVAGVRTIEAWWDAFRRGSQPHLTPALVLSGRADQAADLLRVLEQDTRQTNISGASPDDVLAFVAATLMTAPEPDGSSLLAKTLIVHDANALRRLEAVTELLIVVPFDETLRREARLIHSHHVILVRPDDVRADIALPHVDPEAFAAGLIDLGVPRDAALPLARAARRSIVAFQAETPALAAVRRDWSQNVSSRIARRALMLGAWNESRSGDTDVVETVLGQTYPEAREELSRLARGEDPIFASVGGTWGLVSTEEAWRFAAPQVMRADLEAVERAIQEVLGAVDPALELPPKDRWAAAIHGRIRIHSSDLRRGLASTLAVCGGPSATQAVAGVGTLGDWAAGVVAHLLRRADDDATGDLWASLTDVLPLLAEAAPAVFLEAVQLGMTARSDPLFLKLFADQEGDAFSVNSPHTGLLWALEALTWSPEYASQAIKSLARLAEIDPGGRLSNRPLASLVNVFLPWFPQTALNADRRLAVLDMLIRDHPQVAWQVMLQLLPDAHGTAFPTHKPQYRPWPRDDPKVSRDEFWTVSSETARRLLGAAESEEERWPELLAKLSHFPPPVLDMALERLDALAADADGDLRESIWSELDELVRRHRSFSEAKWALPETVLERLANTAARFRPVDPVDRQAWLFNEHFPDLPSGTKDVAARRAELESVRRKAVEDVFQAQDLAGVERLARTVKLPNCVGVAAEELQSPDLDAFAVAHLDAEDVHLIDFSVSYVRTRTRREPAWFGAVLETTKGRPVAQARAFLCQPASPELWLEVAAAGRETEKAYWDEFEPYGRGDFVFVNEAAEHLLKFGRAATAVDLLSLYARGTEERLSGHLIARALDALLGAPPEEREASRLQHYDFEALLDYVRRSDVDEETLGLLEWRLLPALSFDAPSPTLERRLSRDPAFFVEVLSFAYRSRDGEAAQPEVPEHVSRNAYRLLSEWSHLPGVDEFGQPPNAEELNRWLDEARELARDAHRREVADVTIGKLLAHSNSGPDEPWPPEAVRDAIERMASAEVEDGFRTEVLNMRGPTTRAPGAGGDQERALAGTYRGQAEAIRDGWPRTAAALASVAASYDRQARREDGEAERYREGFER
ncbi:MAG: hypothetical protein AB7I08_02245 [Thermoleophilia bacterium]